MFNIFRKKHESLNFKFQHPEDKICFTCDHVHKQGKDILFISHDEEDDWQFMCGEGNHETENGVLICLKHAVEIDSSINEMWNLPIGYAAERNNKKSEWVIFENPSED